MSPTQMHKIGFVEDNPTSWRDILENIPNEIFFNANGHPNFNAIFVELSRRMYHQSGNNFSIPAQDFLTGKLPNLTSFQRGVTKERQRRAG